MKIYIIRHARVDMEWPDRCTSHKFEELMDLYNTSNIDPVKEPAMNVPCNNIYVSNLVRSLKTAQGLFPNAEHKKLEDIMEVPISPYKDTEGLVTVWSWNFFGRLQWFLNNRRQPEVRKDTYKRAQRVVDVLEDGGLDCVLVSHAFFIKTLVKVLKKNGYKVEGDRPSGLRNLEMVIAYK